MRKLTNAHLLQLARLAAIALSMLMLFVIWDWVVKPYTEWLFNGLAETLQHYLSVYTSYPYAGWWAAWIVIALAAGILNRAFTTELGAIIVLILTVGLITRGHIYEIPYGGGGHLISVHDTAVQRVGRAIGFMIAIGLTAFIVLHLITFGLGRVALVAIGAHAAGYCLHKWHRLGWKFWTLIVAMVALTIIAADFTPTDVNNLIGWILVFLVCVGLPVMLFLVACGFFAKAFRAASGR